MKIEEKTIDVLGQQLHHLVLHPETSPTRGLVFFHGQGDHIDRYADILKPFVDAGFKCLLTDLPGHGRSPGKRGHIPHLGFVDEVLNSSLKEIDGPASIAGHSMGGLMTLRLLLNNPGQFEKSWISSPLLDPMHQAKPWMRKILPFIAPIFPGVTVSTGVKSEDCRKDSPLEISSSPQLFHSRISLSWGPTLASVADKVRANFNELHGPTKLLFTQGQDDQICPPEFLRDRLVNTSHPFISYEEIQGARHEPFVGATGEELQKKVTQWLAQTASITY